MPKFQEERAKRRLETLRRTEEEESVKIVSQKYRIPYADLMLVPVETDTIQIVEENGARQGELVVFEAVGNQLKIGVRNPEKAETKAVLNRLADKRFKYDLFLVSKTSLETAWKIYKKVPPAHEASKGAVEINEARLGGFRKEINDIDSLKEHIRTFGQKHVTETLEMILGGSLAVDASDFHLEPRESDARLRLRLDGVLYDVAEIPKRLYQLLLSRIKLISELKLNVRDRAQDGRFTIKSDATAIEVRTSTLPGPDGENIVLRILDPKSIQITFEELGMQPRVAGLMETELKKPNGMILTTGPTGSGKTTTLYAFVRKVYNPGVKIITIEDPIEYHLAGIEQTQVNPEKGYDFANGLRSIVRQDPDVILVGEIRDLETAQTAMHASLTGHLVFSTLHTNSAAGTIPRLLDLGVKPAIIAPAINIMMAQRLVRKLCEKCTKIKKLNREEEKMFEKGLAELPPGVVSPPPASWRVREAAREGCEACSGIGYKGRMGIFEVIAVTDEFESLILREPTETEIKKEAARQGQITMRQDGLLKVLAGVTDFAELERVVGSA